MKIKIWIRCDALRNIKIHTDYECETRDTPRVNAMGMRLIAAIESCEKTDEDRESDPRKMRKH